MSTTFSRKSELSRCVVLALMVILILYYVISHILAGIDIGFRVVVSVVPLAIFLPGIYLRKHRSASLLCFVLLLYFMVGVQSLFTPGNALPESFAMAIICTLFCVSMFYSRWQQRADVLENNAAQQDT